MVCVRYTTEAGPKTLCFIQLPYLFLQKITCITGAEYKGISKKDMGNNLRMKQQCRWISRLAECMQRERQPAMSGTSMICYQRVEDEYWCLAGTSHSKTDFK